MEQMETKPLPKLDMLPPPEMADKAAMAGLKKVQMDLLSMTLLSVLAGGFIAMGGDFYLIITTGSSALPFGVAKTLGGLAFCLGLILVVIGGAELFTGNNLIVMAVLQGKVAPKWLLWNWIVVWVGNFIGSVAVAWVIWSAEQHKMGDGAVGKLAVTIAATKCSLAFWPALCKGIMCNVLVCLAVWLCFSARTTTDRILAIIFPITAFVAGGFEHCVANMFFVPLGMLVNSGVPAAGTEALNVGNFLVNNLVPVTLGNIIGGAVFVGAVFWFLYCRRTPKYANEKK